MPESRSRRGFLRTAGALALVSPIMEAFGADPAPLYDGEIVDTHLHLWDLKVMRPPWIEGTTGHARDVLAHDHKLADFAEAARGLKVTRAVYMEVDVAESDEIKEAEYVTGLIAEGKSPMVAAVISGRPASDGFGDYLDHFKSHSSVKGLRQVLHTGATPPDYCLEPSFVRGVQILGDRGLTFDLCLRNDQLETGARLIERCPGTRFVLDHCGNPHAGKNDLDAWRKGLAKIAALKDRTVICKVSGLYANVKAADWPAERLAPIVRSVIDLFGWDRVIFAGDWPVVNLGASYRVWVDSLKQIVRDDAPTDQAKLFRDNALRFYGLPRA
jgi:L-fuconolactonase